jgi:polysaccharide lyase-like protein
VVDSVGDVGERGAAKPRCGGAGRGVGRAIASLVLALVCIGGIGVSTGISMSKQGGKPTDEAPAPGTLNAGSGGFVGDFEVGSPGWQQFSGLQYEPDRPLADSFSLVSSPVRAGQSAARFVVRQGYSRFGHNEDSEAVWHSDEREGDDYWYAWSTLFPPDWQPPYNWGLFAQWHANLPTSPIIGFDARADTASLGVHTGLTDVAHNAFAVDRNLPLLETLSKGRWNDFVMHVRWTRSKTGTIEVYHRLAGQVRLRLLARVRHIPTFQYAADGSGTGTYLLFGLYRRSYCPQPTVLDCVAAKGVQPPTTIYDDSFVRGRTFAATAARAFPGPPPALPKSK